MGCARAINADAGMEYKAQDCFILWNHKDPYEWF